MDYLSYVSLRWGKNQKNRIGWGAYKTIEYCSKTGVGGLLLFNIVFPSIIKEKQ